MIRQAARRTFIYIVILLIILVIGILLTSYFGGVAYVATLVIAGVALFYIYYQHKASISQTRKEFSEKFITFLGELQETQTVSNIYYSYDDIYRFFHASSSVGLITW